MKSISLVIAVALLIQVICAPCFAQEALSGDLHAPLVQAGEVSSQTEGEGREFEEDVVSANSLSVSDYVEVRYYASARINRITGRSSRRSAANVRGYVAEVGKQSMVVRTSRGSLTIRYDRIIELVRTQPLSGEPLPPKILTPGKKVRIYAPSVVERYIIGEITSAAPGVLGVKQITPRAEESNVAVMHRTHLFPIESIEQCEVMVERSRTFEGAVFGMLPGVVLVIAGGVMGPDKEASIAIATDDMLAAAGGVLSLIGLLTGAFIGSKTKKGNWWPVPPEQMRIDLTAQRQGGGPAVVASFSF